MKIVGLMPVYEESDWIEYAVEGIIDLVDELVIAEGYMGPFWHFGSCRSGDDTIPILNRLAKKYDKITLVYSQPRRHLLKGRAATYNHMLSASKIASGADWIMICDADEFYTVAQRKEIRRIVASCKKDSIAVKARYFFFNFKNFIYVELPRIFRITSNMYFLPGQFPHYSNGTPYYSDGNPWLTILGECPMFHYSLVKRPTSEIKRRIMEYCAAQREKWIFDWIDDILLKWTPENSDEIYALNESKYDGKGGIIFGGGCEAQKLLVYGGEHPEIMKKHPFRNIEDVRKIEGIRSPVASYVLPRHHFAHIVIKCLQKVAAICRR